MTRHHKVYPVLNDAGVLRDMYVEQGMSPAEIASRVGCSTSLIAVALATHGIPSRGNSGPRRKLAGMSRDATVEALTQFRSRRSAAIGIGVSSITLAKHCGLVGLTPEDLDGIFRLTADARSDALREAAQVRKASKQEERQAYHQEIVQAYADGATIHEIGAGLGHDPALIWRILRKNGVDTSAKKRNPRRKSPEDIRLPVAAMRTRAARLRRQADDLDAKADALVAEADLLAESQREAAERVAAIVDDACGTVAV